MAGVPRPYNPPMVTPPVQGLRGLASAGPLRGTLRPPGSKSLAQRALLAAAFAAGITRLRGLPDNDDVRAALDTVRAFGVELLEEDGGVAVLGVSPAEGDGPRPRDVLALGESGTLARLATALAAFAAAPGVEVVLGVKGSLLLRRSLPFFQTLARARVPIVRQNLPGSWPVALVATRPEGALSITEPGSSQEVSGLLLALAALGGRRTLEVHGAIPSRPYLAMTVRLLADFGARVEELAEGDGVRFLVEGPLRAPAARLAIEPDASSAAVALAAACLTDGEVRVEGIGADSPQGDARIVDHLRAFGCRAGRGADALWAGGAPSAGASLDLVGEPDLAPVLVPIAACAARRTGAPSRLSGLGTLPGKESDRLEVLARALGELGYGVEREPDALTIGPGERRTSAHTFDPHGDHRMAFAFALLGLLHADVRVQDAGCVAKSWPDFWSDLGGLGARLLEGPAPGAGTL